MDAACRLLAAAGLPPAVAARVRTVLRLPALPPPLAAEQRRLLERYRGR